MEPFAKRAMRMTDRIANGKADSVTRDAIPVYVFPYSAPTTF